MYKVDLSTKAQTFYQKADRPLALKIARCFEQLEREPHNHPNIKPLTANFAGHFRYRVGDYRVIYRGDEAQQIVFVVIIAHRSEVYEYGLRPNHAIIHQSWGGAPGYDEGRPSAKKQSRRIPKPEMKPMLSRSGIRIRGQRAIQKCAQCS